MYVTEVYVIYIVVSGSVVIAYKFYSIIYVGLGI